MNNIFVVKDIIGELEMWKFSFRVGLKEKIIYKEKFSSLFTEMKGSVIHCQCLSII